MKSLSSLILTAAFVCSFNAQAALIVDDTLVLNPGSSSIIDDENRSLFRAINLGVLADDFDPNARFANPLTHIALSGTSVSNTVTASEVVNSDGTITRTTSDVRTTTERTLLDVILNQVTEVSGFLFSNISFSGNSIFLDFQDLMVFDTSSLTLGVVFESVSTSEILNQNVEILPGNTNPSNPTLVSEPQMFVAGLLALMMIFIRAKFTK